MFYSRYTVSLLVLSTLSLAIPMKKRADVCNGRRELCSRSYGNVTFVGAHDSYANSKNPLEVGRDQTIDLPTQLSSGVRLLQAQSHMKDGVIHFCHTSCLLFDGGSVVDYLKTVKTFLDANPNEVLTLLFTNPEGLSMNQIWLPAFQSSGMDQLSFIPPNNATILKQSDWPTLGEMIDSGKRVVTFMDANADDPNDHVGFILPEFPNVWETPFDSTDSSFPCKVDRSAGPNADADHMYLINHYLDLDIFGALVPNKLEADKTNGVDSILADAAGCAGLANGRAPNFVLMDWVDEGEPFKAADILNGFA